MKLELENAVEKIVSYVDVIGEFEEVELELAVGRIVAEDIYAPIDNPPFNRSPLDGYAIFSEDTIGASRETPAYLNVIEEVFAGGYPKKKLNKGEATRIMTGAPIPEGADAVIMQEETDLGMVSAAIYKELSPYDNFCWKGEDIKKGTLIIKKATKLNYIHIGVLAEMGMSKVFVLRKPKILLITTGDELCDLGEELSPGKIYNGNLHILSSHLKNLGVDIFKKVQIGDDAKKISKVINNYVSQCDLIVSTGGVSTGKKDILHDVVKELGAEKIFWRVNVKPGTPALFSVYKGKPIISLSGNPFAAFSTFQLLVRPALFHMTGDDIMRTERKSAIMASDFEKKSPSRRFVRAYYKDDKVYLPSGHSSGMIFSMAGCNALIDVEGGSEGLKVGDEVNIIII
jgi:molybdopterin molybdotransferase